MLRYSRKYSIFVNQTISSIYKQSIIMKKTILFFLATMLLGACQHEDIVSTPDETGKIQSIFDLSDEDVLQGCIRVKLKEEPVGGVSVRNVGNTVTTGVKALDRSASTLKITRMERTFPYAGKYEERTRKEGLHLWYNVWFSKDTPATRAATEVSILDDIEMAVPIPKVVSTAANEETVWAVYGARAGEWLFNDPEHSKQWYFNNPGTETWQEAGADIRLLDVWKQYNGHPDIIVSVVDGGIAPDHPDLQDNLWTNPNEIPDNGMDDDGNGYIDDVHGYNFVSNSATIVGHRHGTHVAGTIGATNDNSVGISSIAGGNGTPDSGVKLMSCQILKHNGFGDDIANDIGAAIKYGADNGAVISQNSWGYAADTKQYSYIDPTHKAAIDYFIKYAGCDNNGEQLEGSPMKGGIVFFASGNNNTSNPRTAAPADYEEVVAVAAITADYKKASYSNYGSYMDISAPGGSNVSGRGEIWSTTIKSSGYYEYRSGTSMACPLVSGVAALVIEKYGVGKKGFTPNKLKEILYESAYDLDKYNPGYTGQLGHGGVDATAALNIDVSSLRPFTLKSNQITDNTLVFSVNSGLAGEGKLALYNSIGNKVLSQRITLEALTLHSVDISKLSAGYYILVYECNGVEVKEKFIKY